MKINDALIAFYFVNFIVFGMKTSLTFELARKAALHEVEAALRLCRNCTLRLKSQRLHS